MRRRPDADGGLAAPHIDPPRKPRVIRPKILCVGTPVFLVSTENPDGSFNLAPASSYWALGQMLVLGLETDGQSVQNLLERPGFTVNFPSPAHWRAVERLAALIYSSKHYFGLGDEVGWTRSSPTAPAVTDAAAASARAGDLP